MSNVIQKVINESTTITLQENAKYHLTISENQTIDLWLDYSHDIDVVVEIDVEKNANLNVVHCYSGNLYERLQYNLKENSNTKIVIVALDKKAINQKVTVDLIGEHARVEVVSGLLVKELYNLDIAIVHKAKHTYANMEHYAVVSDLAILKLYGVGKICEKMSGSAAHQTTRVLTMAKDHLCEVTPVLIIDENDVAASHANSIGQPDDLQLYYLQSRGLTIEQSLNLISTGYLEPMLILIEGTSLHSLLQNMIETKVG